MVMTHAIFMLVVPTTVLLALAVDLAVLIAWARRQRR
jgi:hypothetical protein